MKLVCSQWSKTTLWHIKTFNANEINKRYHQVIGYPEGPIVDASWQTTGPFVPPTSVANFAPLAHIMESQPLIGVQALTGSFECSHFNWGLRTGATIAPARGMLR